MEAVPTELWDPSWGQMIRSGIIYACIDDPHSLPLNFKGRGYEFGLKIALSDSYIFENMLSDNSDFL